MFLDDIFGMRLDEAVNGRFAIAFHRTKSVDRVMDIDSTGFYAGDGALYGRGIYLTYDFESQQTDYMRRYGTFIVKSRVALNDFLIFDEAPAREVYGENWTIRDQWKHFGLSTEDDLGSVLVSMEEALQNAEFSSLAARRFANARKKMGGVSGVLKDIRGLAFTGRSDGRVIVAYKPSDVIPYAYARVLIPHEYDNKPAKKLEAVKWKPLNVKSAVQRVLRPNPASLALAASKFLTRRGFTIVTRRSSRILAVKRLESGATLVGMWSNATGGSFHLTRHWPEGVLDGKQAEIAFGRTQATGIVVARQHSGKRTDFREDRAFLTALAYAERAVERLQQARDHQIALAAAVIKEMVKPGTNIRSKAVGNVYDFGHDKLLVYAESPGEESPLVSIVVEAPYRAIEDEIIDNAWKQANRIIVRTTFIGEERRTYVTLGFTYPVDAENPTQVVNAWLDGQRRVYQHVEDIELPDVLDDKIAAVLKARMLPSSQMRLA